VRPTLGGWLCHSWQGVKAMSATHSKRMTGWILTAATCASVAAMPLTARAHDRIDLNIRLGEPVACGERTVRIWVEPVYRTITDRVWVEPVYKTVCENVWVPDRCEVRERTCFEHGRRIVREERIVIPGHFDRVERRVL